jgi:hypothetical protein
MRSEAFEFLRIITKAKKADMKQIYRQIGMLFPSLWFPRETEKRKIIMFRTGMKTDFSVLIDF